MGHSTITGTIYADAPLGPMNQIARGLTIQKVVRALDEILHQECVFELPSGSTCWRGRLLGIQSQSCDWLRGGQRIECKSAQLRFHKQLRGWVFQFWHIKLGGLTPKMCDELVLALYTPAGIHVYRHDFRLGVASNGKATPYSGYSICLCGPSGEADWRIALASILRKLDSSQCVRLAFVDFSL